MKRVTITMTERQAAALSLACEMVARFHLGQFDMLRFVRNDMLLPGEFNTADLIRCLVFPDSENTKGIRHSDIPDTSRILWDMYQVLRHYLSWKDQPNTPATRDWSKQMGVNFDEPMKTDDDPLPEIETTKEA